MLIIGEKINSTRQRINRALISKDSHYIQQVAVDQVANGAQVLDVNCGINIKNEPELMSWLVRIVQEKVKVSLVIDSPNPDALEAGLKVHQGSAIVNSITAEKNRYEKILPLVKKYQAKVIALTIDEKGMPRTARERFDLAKKLVKVTAEHGIPAKDVYIDSLVHPVSTEPQQVTEFLEALRLIKTLPDVQTICGLSNVSFGLPNRSLLNATFVAMVLCSGLDAAIIDPTDKSIRSAIKAAEALLNRDQYCASYIAAHRESKL